MGYSEILISAGEADGGRPWDGPGRFQGALVCQSSMAICRAARSSCMSSSDVPRSSVTRVSTRSSSSSPRMAGILPLDGVVEGQNEVSKGPGPDFDKVIAGDDAHRIDDCFSA